MFQDFNIERVSAAPDSETVRRVAALTEACIARVDSLADRPSDWTEESALAHWFAYLLRIAWARFPSDAQARAEEAFELGTYYRPDAWDDGDFIARDLLQQIAEEYDAVPRLVTISTLIREHGVLEDIHTTSY